MSRILISWIAYTHDFTLMDNGRPRFNPEGTHGDCYRHDIFKYKEHILLSHAAKVRDDIRFEMAVNGLQELGARITPRYLGLKKEDVINIEVLIKSVEKVIAEYAQDDIEVYISPGTPAMQKYRLRYRPEHTRR